jgi:hypothetical protein
METSCLITATEFKKDGAEERKQVKYISYDVNPDKVSPKAMKMWDEMRKQNNSDVETTRLLDLDRVVGRPAWILSDGGKELKQASIIRNMLVIGVKFSDSSGSKCRRIHVT